MGLTATDRGTGSNNSSSTSMSFSPGSNMTAGALGVLCIALDNAGSSGSTAAAPTSFTDAKGNTWTRRQDAIQDPGNASAGAELAIYTAAITTALLTSDSSTINWAGGVLVTAKAWTLREITTDGGAGKFVGYISGGVGTGASTGTPTVTTGSITSGDCVIGAGGAESADTWAGDGDTSNGSWSTHQHTGVGSGNSGMSVTSQAKVVTGTSTQTYNPTLTSADCILAWVQVRELNQYILTVAQGSFTLTGQTVQFSRTRKVIAASGSFTLSGHNVTLSYSGSGAGRAISLDGSDDRGRVVLSAAFNAIGDFQIIARLRDIRLSHSSNQRVFYAKSTPSDCICYIDTSNNLHLTMFGTSEPVVNISGHASDIVIKARRVGAELSIEAWDSAGSRIGGQSVSDGTTAGTKDFSSGDGFAIGGDNWQVGTLIQAKCDWLRWGTTVDSFNATRPEDSHTSYDLLRYEFEDDGQDSSGNVQHLTFDGSPAFSDTPGGAQNHSLTAASGNFSLTGNAAALKVGRLVSCASGSLALTGQAVGVSRGRSIVASAGSFMQTGNAANLLWVHRLAADAGLFVETGQNVSLKAGRRLGVGSGTFNVTGNQTGVAIEHRLAAETGVFTQIGNNASLLFSRLISAAPGSISMGGVNVALRAERKLIATSGFLVVTGHDADLIYQAAGQFQLSADLGAFALTGNPVNLPRTRVLGAGSGSFTKTGQVANLLWNHKTDASQGLFALAGVPAGLLRGLRLNVSPGALSYSGADIGLKRGFAIQISTGLFTVSGQPVGLAAARTLAVEAGPFSLTGQHLSLSRNRVITVATGSFTLTGQTVQLTAQGAVRLRGVLTVAVQNNSHTSVIIRSNETGCEVQANLHSVRISNG